MCVSVEARKRRIARLWYAHAATDYFCDVHMQLQLFLWCAHAASTVFVMCTCSYKLYLWCAHAAPTVFVMCTCSSNCFCDVHMQLQLFLWCAHAATNCFCDVHMQLKTIFVMSTCSHKLLLWCAHAAANCFCDVHMQLKTILLDWIACHTPHNCTARAGSLSRLTSVHHTFEVWLYHSAGVNCLSHLHCAFSRS